jgi:hypothetical protein
MSAQPQSDPGCRVFLTRTRAAFARFVRNALLLVHETVLESGLSFLMLARTAIASGQKWSANQGPARVQIGWLGRSCQNLGFHILGLLEQGQSQTTFRSLFWIAFFTNQSIIHRISVCGPSIKLYGEGIALRRLRCFHPVCRFGRPSNGYNLRRTARGFLGNPRNVLTLISNLVVPKRRSRQIMTHFGLPKLG